MSTTKKLTKKDYFAIIRKNLPTDTPNYHDVIEWIDHEVELLDKKKATATSKPTKQQQENMDIADAIEAYMRSQPNRLFTITELMKEVAACSERELGNQKVSALVRPMVRSEENPNGSIIRTEVKGRANFQIAKD